MRNIFQRTSIYNNYFTGTSYKLSVAFFKIINSFITAVEFLVPEQIFILLLSVVVINNLL